MTIKPNKPYDDRAGDESRDFAGAGRFSIYALERMLRDMAEQPEWRLRAAISAAYYDGKQLSETQRWHIRREELEERATNLIRPVINSVLGQEARSRTDVKLEADDDGYSDVAEVISMRLKEAERETRAHMGVSEGYSSQVKKGLGWVHVCRASDPLAYPYRVEFVPIDEVWWDWRGQRGVVLDHRCRWLSRMRFIDLDEVLAAYPKHRDILKRSVSGWADHLSVTSNHLGEPEEVHLIEAFDNERRFNLSWYRWDWIDSARKMVKLVEVWYRVPAAVVFIRLGRRNVVYNERDPRHVEAVARGLVKVFKGQTSQIRRALYAGPHRLLDEATDYKSFPYVPFFAFRDDADGSPYGLIEGMISPQDEYNERRLRIQWMLKARQIQIDSDALDKDFNTIAHITENVMRPDMVAITNPNRRNGNQPAIKIANDLSLQKEQFEVMQDSKQLIQDTAGRYSSQLGNAQVQSGIANSLLIEQGEQSMGELNDNYTTARRTVFEQLVDLIIEDHSAEQMRVPVGQGKSKRIVVLNAWQPYDDEGNPVPVEQPTPHNIVADANITTALAEVPNTPAYRQQTQQQLKDILMALGNNPQATAILAPAYLETTTLPNRQQVADDLRKATGVPVPGDKAGREQAEQQAQALQAEQQEAMRLSARAKIDVDVSAAERNRAQAAQAAVQTQLLQQRAEAGGGTLEAAKIAAEIENMGEAANDEDALIDDALNEASAA